MDKQFAEQIAGWFGVGQSDFQSAIKKEDGSELDAAGIVKFLEDSYKAHIDSLGKMKFDHGTRSAKTTLEKAIKDKFGVDAKTYEEALEALEAKINSGGSSKGEKTDLENLSIEDLKKNKLFQQALEESQSQVIENWQKKYADLEKQHNSFVSQTTQRQLLNKGKELAFKALKGKNAVGSDSESFMDAVEIYLRGLGLENLKLTDSGEIQIIDGDNQKTDEYGKPVTFDQHVVSNWRFGFNEAKPGDGAPRRGNQQGGNQQGGVKPISEQQFNQIMDNPAATAQQRSEAQRGYAEYLRQQEG